MTNDLRHDLIEKKNWKKYIQLCQLSARWMQKMRVETYKNTFTACWGLYLENVQYIMEGRIIVYWILMCVTGEFGCFNKYWVHYMHGMALVIIQGI